MKAPLSGEEQAKHDWNWIDSGDIAVWNLKFPRLRSWGFQKAMPSQVIIIEVFKINVFIVVYINKSIKFTAATSSDFPKATNHHFIKCFILIIYAYISFKI